MLRNRVAHVEVSGTSIAAAAVARLLQRAGHVPMVQADRAAPRVPAVMVGTATRTLLADVFENSGDPMAGLWEIHRRRVLWGHAPVAVVPHRAWVMTSVDLSQPAAPAGGEPAWRIYAGGPADIPAATAIRPFGQREARAWPVLLRPGADAQACVVESLAEGWLFLLPVSEQQGWLLTVGSLDSASTALSQSRLLLDTVDQVTSPTAGVFECHPRLAVPVAGPGWLCCGSAAAGFDPLCGDGVGNALREAILASAVVTAAQRDPALASLALAHYERQLRAAMFRHLQVCAGFYATGGNGAWWMAQRDSTLAAAAELHEWLSHTAPQFRLQGFALEKLTPDNPATRP